MVRKSSLFSKDFFSSITRKPSKIGQHLNASHNNNNGEEEPRHSIRSKRSLTNAKSYTKSASIISTVSELRDPSSTDNTFNAGNLSSNGKLGSSVTIAEPIAMQLASSKRSQGSPSPVAFSKHSPLTGSSPIVSSDSRSAKTGSPSTLGSGSDLIKEPPAVVLASTMDPLSENIPDYCKYFDIESFDHSKLDLNSYDHSLPTSQSSDFETYSSSATSASSINTGVCLPTDTACVRQFKSLDADLTRFKSKTGLARSNALRLSLLSFLRTDPPVSSIDLPLKLNVMGKWWSSLLEDLVNKNVTVSDRSAYLEGISGLMSRPEWAFYDRTLTNQTVVDEVENVPQTSPYQVLLYQTLSFVMSKLSMKNVPMSISVFSGKVLAYSFYFAPGVAQCLLHILAVPQDDINRICRLCLPEPDNSDDAVADVEMIRHSVPLHVAHLVGYKKGRRASFPRHMARQHCPSVPCSPLLDHMYGSWTRRWASSSSDVFYAFLKHYYYITAFCMNSEIATKWQQVILFPGMLVIHGFLLGSLDYAIKSRPAPAANANGAPPPQLATSALPTTRTSPPPPATSSAGKVLRAGTTAAPVDAIAALPPLPPPQRQKFEQLKLLSCIRTVLHSEEVCAPLFLSYSRLFESILQSTALRVNVYDAETCINFADLVEEFLGSLLCGQQAAPIDWGFWICVAQRMLCTDSVQTELRALALLYNLWENLTKFDGRSLPEHAFNGYLDTVPNELKSEECPLDTITDWLLSAEVWSKYFGHWQPLIRAYFHRLLCWRVALRDPNLLAKRLVQTFDQVQSAISDANEKKTVGPILDPAPPVVGRKLEIYMKPPRHEKANGMFSRIHPYDVFDDYVYSSTSFMPEEQMSSAASIKSVATSASISSSKAKSALSGLKRYLSSAVGATPPSEKRKTMIQPKAIKTMAPDIDRPLHRFCLDFCPQSAHRPVEVIMSKRGLGAPVVPTQVLPLPSLPATEFNEFGGVMMNSDSDIRQLAESAMPDDELLPMTPYEGRSLSEWNRTVMQFNEYCRSQRLMAGAQRFSDIEIPFLAVDLARNLR